MISYSYKAKSENGQTITGEVQTPSLSQAADLLRKKRLVIISLQPTRPSLWRTLTRLLQRENASDVVTFTRQLATMIVAGLPLSDALRILKLQASPVFATRLSMILGDIEGGMSFSDALQKHKRIFSPVYIALVRVGEAAGVLDSILNRLGENLEKQKEFGSKVKSALVYPAIVISGMIVVTIVMMVFVMPKLTDLYKSLGTELPTPTKILIDVSTTFAKFWYLFIILIGLVTVFFLSWIRTQTGREVYEAYMFKVPVFGRLRLNVILTEFTRTLGLLVGAGIPILEALRITGEAVGNSLIRQDIQYTSSQVSKGLPLVVPLSQSEYFPPILAQMVGVGEETGKVDEVLLKLATYFEAESARSVSALTAAIEPLIMIVLGIGVGFLVIAIILPIYNLTSAF